MYLLGEQGRPGPRVRAAGRPGPRVFGCYTTLSWLCSAWCRLQHGTRRDGKAAATGRLPLAHPRTRLEARRALRKPDRATFHRNHSTHATKTIRCPHTYVPSLKAQKTAAAGCWPPRGASRALFGPVGTCITAANQHIVPYAASCGPSLALQGGGQGCVQRQRPE
jgi:hypothetical protein